MLHYCPVKRDDPILRARIKEIAHTRIRYGYERITILLRREGWQVNRKRVRRIYREENLAIRAKTPKRRRAAVVRTERVVPSAPNQSWAMDFMHDVLALRTTAARPVAFAGWGSSSQLTPTKQRRKVINHEPQQQQQRDSLQQL